MNNHETLMLLHSSASEAEYNAKYYREHKDWKRDYNKKYYQENKDYWVDRLRAREKNVTGSSSISRRRIVNDRPLSREKNVAGTASISVRDPKREDYLSKEAARSSKTGQAYSGALTENAIYGKPQEKKSKNYGKYNKGDSYTGQTLSEGDKLARAAGLSGSLKDKAKLFGYEVKQSSKNAASTWASGAKSIASAASKYGTNWKSGAKDIISKGSSIVSGLRAKLGF